MSLSPSPARKAGTTECRPSPRHTWLQAGFCRQTPRESAPFFGPVGVIPDVQPRHEDRPRRCTAANDIQHLVSMCGHGLKFLRQWRVDRIPGGSGEGVAGRTASIAPVPRAKSCFISVTAASTFPSFSILAGIFGVSVGIEDAPAGADDAPLPSLKAARVISAVPPWVP